MVSLVMWFFCYSTHGYFNSFYMYVVYLWNIPCNDCFGWWLSFYFLWIFLLWLVNYRDDQMVVYLQHAKTPFRVECKFRNFCYHVAV
jgi:hypothetical protein